MLPLIVVAGPTASGKTSLAVALAKHLDSEIVSADSMQIYHGITVASACVTPEEQEGVPHHLVDFLPLTESYNVARYAHDARRVIADIHARHKTPILCGGTGLYIAAVTDNVCYEEQDDAVAKAVREELQCLHKHIGDEGMWERLQRVDPVLAHKLHIHDRTRVMRGLEVYELTGIPMSVQQQRQKETPSPYDATKILLDFRDRSLLYERINRRVDIMVKNGLLEETAAIVRQEYPTAMQAIGCKELKPYFNGDCSLQEALDCMKRRSRQYAKRQLSWFRRWTDAQTFYVDDYRSSADLLTAVINLL